MCLQLPVDQDILRETHDLHAATVTAGFTARAVGGAAKPLLARLCLELSSAHRACELMNSEASTAACTALVESLFAASPIASAAAAAATAASQQQQQQQGAAVTTTQVSVSGNPFDNLDTDAAAAHTHTQSVSVSGLREDWAALIAEYRRRARGPSALAVLVDFVSAKMMDCTQVRCVMVRYDVV